MTTLTGPAAVDAYLATLPEPMGPVARAAAKSIRSVLPNAHETCADGDCGFGVAPGYKGLVFTLTALEAHVALGVAGGATLPDPLGLMEGKGGTHRHVKLLTVADAERANLLRLLTAAAKRRQR